MNKVRTFTSTGMKLIHHPDVVRRIKTDRRASPISLQIAPTSKCNLRCDFCSNPKRQSHESLDFGEIITLMHKLKKRGLRTVEWTGGGDPTMYTQINAVIDAAALLGLEQGFITNGILLKDNLSEASLKALKWIRVSVNALEYVDKLDLPKFEGTLGFSYVNNDRTTQEVMFRIHEHVRRYRPKYVRIVTNCLATDEEQAVNNRILGDQVAQMGDPYFYQPKVFGRSKSCWWCYIKPFVLHDGFVYPCSSVVLNSDADGKFNEKYRWTTIDELPGKYEEIMIPFDSDSCDHCVFKEQNDLVDTILFPRMENFV